MIKIKTLLQVTAFALGCASMYSANAKAGSLLDDILFVSNEKGAVYEHGSLGTFFKMHPLLSSGQWDGFTRGDSNVVTYTVRLPNDFVVRLMSNNHASDAEAAQIGQQLDIQGFKLDLQLAFTKIGKEVHLLYCSFLSDGNPIAVDEKDSIRMFNYMKDGSTNLSSFPINRKIASELMFCLYSDPYSHVVNTNEPLVTLANPLHSEMCANVENEDLPFTFVDIKKIDVDKKSKTISLDAHIRVTEFNERAANQDGETMFDGGTRPRNAQKVENYINGYIVEGVYVADTKLTMTVDYKNVELGNLMQQFYPNYELVSIGDLDSKYRFKFKSSDGVITAQLGLRPVKDNSAQITVESLTIDDEKVPSLRAFLNGEAFEGAEPEETHLDI